MGMKERKKIGWLIGRTVVKFLASRSYIVREGNVAGKVGRFVDW